MSTRADAAMVAHMARLARLQVGADETAGLVRDLSAILGYVEELQTVDTANVEPMIHAAQHGTPLRADVVQPGLTPEDIRGNAPAMEAGSFAVPRVLGQGT